VLGAVEVMFNKVLSVTFNAGLKIYYTYSLIYICIAFVDCSALLFLIVLISVFAAKDINV
jgi:hypothetical protein